jgi:hypothetical protein
VPSVTSLDFAGPPDHSHATTTPPNAIVVSESQGLDLVEQNGRELAESFLNAARNGDWRAAQALMDRIYGKPEQAIVARVRSNPVPK